MTPKNKLSVAVTLLSILPLSAITQVTGESPLMLPAYSITTDYNLDGNEDLVYTIDDTVFIATRHGYSTSPLHQFTLSDPAHVRAGDIDGDRFPELVFSNAGQVRYVKNNSGISGEVVIVEATGQRYVWTAVFDYDLDGDGDLLQNTYDLNIYFIENDSGTFHVNNKLLLGHTNKIETQTDEYFCDVDQDGYMDAWLYQPPYGMMIMRNYGDGRIGIREYFATRNVSNLASEEDNSILFDTDDHNLDGFPDMFQLQLAYGVIPHLLITLNRFGSTSIEEIPIVLLEGSPLALDVIDVNGDLIPDVITADAHHITALYAVQDTFEHVVVWNEPDTSLPSIGKIDVADFDEDGLLEIIVIDINGSGRILSTSWQSSGEEYTCSTLPDPLDCPPGDITFSTQAALDQFILAYPNCTHVNGHLIIKDEVTDLDPLSNVIAVYGSVEFKDTQVDSLQNTNLRFVHGNLRIADNPNLTAILFDQLRSVRDTLLISNLASVNIIDSFNLLEYAGNIRIETNQQLHSVRGFQKPMLGEEIALIDNPVLDTVYAFYPTGNVFGHGITDFRLKGKIPGAFAISGQLDSFFLINATAMDLRFLRFTGFKTLVLDRVTGMTSLNGLSRTPWYNAVVNACPDFTDLGGGVKLTGLEIRNCPSFTSLSGFTPGIMTGLSLIDNPLLSSLNGLPSVPRLMALQLEGNPVLTDISSFMLQLPNTMQSLIIRDNSMLSTCDATWVCNYLKSNKPVIIANNAIGCHNVQVVDAACGFVPPINTDVTDDPGGPIFMPNPADTEIDIISDDVPQSLRLYDGVGRLIIEAKATRALSLDQVPNGIYMLMISDFENVFVARVVVLH